MFSTVVNIGIYAGESDPSDAYELEYYDGYEYSGTGEITEGLATVIAEAGSQAVIRSFNEDSNQVWMVNDTMISGRGTYVSFTVPDADSEFTVTRSSQSGDVPTIINTISDLSGGMAGYTYSDFST